MGLDVIVHPELGIIRGRGKPGYRTWETDPIQIGALGYRAPISLFTTNAEPMQQELALMLSAMQATNGFKARLAGHLLQQYTEYERPAYRKQVGNPEYTSVLTESDLPEIQHPTDIWRLITGLRGVYVEYVNQVADVAYLFTTTFDRDHQFQIRFRDGRLYEMGMDG